MFYHDMRQAKPRGQGLLLLRRFLKQRLKSGILYYNPISSNYELICGEKRSTFRQGEKPTSFMTSEMLFAK